MKGKLLEGKTAVVTGSGQGIGRAIAIALAKEGARVVTNNRRPGSTNTAVLNPAQVNALGREKQEWLRKEAELSGGDAETTAQTIKNAGGEAVSYFGDIGDFKAAAGLIQKAVDTYGSIDILVNVAGNFGFSPIWEITEETWDRVNATKPKGYFNTIRHAVPYMIQNKWGRIINCTSRAFIGDLLRHAEYCASNAGVVGLTMAAAKELYPYGITCNAFAPFARTRASYELAAFQTAVSPEQGPWLDPKFSFPLEVTPSPEQAAPFVTYLASEAAGNISGSVFNVGGNSIGLWSEPEIVKTMIKYGDPWTVDEIIKQAPAGLLKGYRSSALLD